jgi:hypothetical protein
MNRSRRMAAAMCFGAVAVFLLFLSATMQPVAARSCQQQCDAERAAGLQWCNVEYPGVQECVDQVNSYYYTCSTGAMICDDPEWEWSCTVLEMHCYWTGSSCWCEGPSYACQYQ